MEEKKKKEEKQLNKKRLIITIIVLVVIIAAVVTMIVRKNEDEGGVVAIAPSINASEEQDDGMIEYENNIEGIEISDREAVKNQDKYYMKIRISNISEEDKYNLPIAIEFFNKDGDSIFQTGYIQDVLLKGMTDEINAELTREIAYMVKNNEIDHIAIKQLD